MATETLYLAPVVKGTRLQTGSLTSADVGPDAT